MKTTSKLFKISGNFCRGGHFEHDEKNGCVFAHGIWATSKIDTPAFIGKIAMTDERFFCGYCSDIYDQNLSELDKNSYIVGALLPSLYYEQPSIAFYKLSNNPDKAPQMYTIINETDPPTGAWSMYTDVLVEDGERSKRMFLHQGIATVSVEPSCPSQIDHRLIETLFDQCNPHVGYNGMMIDQVENCLESLFEALQATS